MRDALEETLDILKTIFLGLIFIVLLCLDVVYEKQTNKNKYDVNGDGIVSPADYVEIKDYIMERD